MGHGGRGSSASTRATSSPLTIKRKLENDSEFKRQVAQRLLLCADVGDTFEAVQRSMIAHLFKYKQIKARVEALERLQVATEQTARFQALCASELDAVEGGSQLLSLHTRLDKLLSKISRTRPAEQHLEKITRRLPRVIMKGEKIIAEQRQLIAEQAELPGMHQWIPEVLRRLYDDAAAAAREDEQMKPLKGVIHEVMVALRELDPFFFLQVLYQPPPLHLHGRWEVVASEKLTAIAKSMAPFFRDLKRRSFALRNKRDPYMRIHYGWNHLRITMTFVRRAARHFHYLILYLYSVAMGCESPYTHAGIISEKASSGLYSADAKLRSRLRLHGSAVNSSDNLIKETYEWTPELLAYLDEWRRHQDSVAFGFERNEQIRDFIPNFYDEIQFRRHGKRRPQGDVLAAIGGHLRDVDYVWCSSGLGTCDFKSMRIEDVGALEVKVKGSLGAAIDLVYKMMLARWLDRRRRPAAWWSSLEFREQLETTLLPTEGSEIDLTDDSLTEQHTEECQGNQPGGTAAIECNIGKALDVTGIEVERRGELELDKLQESQGTKPRIPGAVGFRAPTKVTFPACPIATSTDLSKTDVMCNDVSFPPAPPGPMVPQQLVYNCPVLLREIYTWTDKDITSFGHDMERIVDVRAAILQLSDRLDLTKVLSETKREAAARPDFGNPIRDDWHVACIANHVSELNNTAVLFAEEVAMHGAANALIARPSLRVSADKIISESVDGSKSTSQTKPASMAGLLQERLRAVQKSISQLVADDNQSPECRERVQSVGRTSLQLLQFLAQGASVDMIAGSK